MKSVVIVANGQSTRYGKNKLNEDVLGSTVLQRTVDVFRGICDEIIVVTNEPYDINGVTFVTGGESRSQSVLCGVKASKGEIVAVHDGARPFVSKALVNKLFDEATTFGSAVPRLAVTDTLWHEDSVASRDEFFTVQTPQVFDRTKLLDALAACCSATDESTAYFHKYGKVHFVEGESTNTKVTHLGDLDKFAIGNGYDVHAFGEGDYVTIGGVRIPFTKKLIGHSDADVLTHAICDAVLSGSNNRDIGVQFPDNDDKYLGINSLLLLEKCVNLAQNNGYEVINVSAEVICEKPKLAPYITQMANNIASVLRIEPTSVNISATTTEKLGSLGNGDGIASTAYCLLRKHS